MTSTTASSEGFFRLFSALTVPVALNKLLPALLTFILCLIVMRICSAVANRLISRSRLLDSTMQGFARSAVKILLWLLTAIIVADTLGIPTTSLVALFSVIGLALSLSIQNIMANIFSGITLLMTKPFSVGDYVTLSDQSGTVKSVGLFYTVISSTDNKLISIPNSSVTAVTITNFNSEPMRRLDMIFSASYDDSTDKVKSAILAALAEDGRISAEPAPFVGLKEYKASSIDYILRLWCKNEDYWDLYYELNERVRESFGENGVTMSYEHINVHMTKE